jgi:Outer membrane protein beta-barrel domain
MKSARNSISRLLGGIASVVILSVAVPQIAQAQTDYPESAFGVKGGVNFTNFYKDNIDDKNGNVGFNAGLYGRFVITEGIAIQPELLYTTRGAEANWGGLLQNSRASVNLGYVQVPVLVMVNILPFLNIHAGPYASYLVNANVKNQSTSNFFNFEDEINKDDYQRLDYGLSGGVGLDFAKFHVGARYDYGLRTIGRERSLLGQNYTFPDAKNSAVQVYVAFDLK